MTKFNGPDYRPNRTDFAATPEKFSRSHFNLGSRLASPTLGMEKFLLTFERSLSVYLNDMKSSMVHASSYS